VGIETEMLRAIKTQWHNVARGFWFYPGLVALAFVGLAVALVELDRGFGTDGIGIVFDGDASAARSILSTVAGSLITVAGLAFSITVVTSQLVSSQFTPRAIRASSATVSASSSPAPSSASSRTACSCYGPCGTRTSRRPPSSPPWPSASQSCWGS
jgi:hypothetical protein